MLLWFKDSSCRFKSLNLQWEEDARKAMAADVDHFNSSSVSTYAEWVGWGWLSGCWDAGNLLH